MTVVPIQRVRTRIPSLVRTLVRTLLMIMSSIHRQWKVLMYHRTFSPTTKATTNPRAGRKTKKHIH